MEEKVDDDYDETAVIEGAHLSKVSLQHTGSSISRI
jgi:hypothetical protein